MKNYGKHILLGCLIIFTAAFATIYYFLYEFRFEFEFYVYVGVCFLVVITALLGGTLVGLITSVFAIFVYAATYLYTTIQSASYFDITFSQGLWLMLYLTLAIIVGKMGDALSIYIKLIKKHPEEMKELLDDSSFHLNSERDFDDAVNNEMIRSRRMKTSFCVATFSLEELPEIIRVFGEKGVYMCMAKTRFYLQTIFRKTDKVAQLNPSTISVLFPEMSKDQLIKRLVHLQRQLDNSYIEYKGTNIKYPIVVSVGVATFPKDGHDIFQLRETMDTMRTTIAEIEKLFMPDTKKTPKKGFAQKWGHNKKEKAEAVDVSKSDEIVLDKTHNEEESNSTSKRKDKKSKAA